MLRILNVFLFDAYERSTYTKAELGYPVHIKTAKSISEILEFDWVYFYEQWNEKKYINKGYLLMDISL